MLLLNIIEIRGACFLLPLKFGSLVVQLQESNLDKGQERLMNYVRQMHSSSYWQRTI